MPARGTDEAARRIGLQPSLVLAPVPDTVLGPEHPTPALAVEHRKIAHGDAKRAWLEVAGSPLFDEVLEANFSFRERIHSHGGDYGDSTLIA